MVQPRRRRFRYNAPSALVWLNLCPHSGMSWTSRGRSCLTMEVQPSSICRQIRSRRNQTLGSTSGFGKSRRPFSLPQRHDLIKTRRLTAGANVRAGSLKKSREGYSGSRTRVRSSVPVPRPVRLSVCGRETHSYLTAQLSASIAGEGEDRVSKRSTSLTISSTTRLTLRDRLRC